MRIALFSDVHANALALKAVIEDMKKNRADRFLFLGDAATLGPDPVFCLCELEKLGAECVLGNHDAFLLNPDLVDQYTRESLIKDAIFWCADRLSPGHMEYLKTFSKSIKIPMGGKGMLLAVHGTPRSFMEEIPAHAPVKELEGHMGKNPPAFLACGHTHMGFIRRHKNTLFINPGSVGLPFLEPSGNNPPTLLPQAEYVLMEINGHQVDIRFRRLPLCGKKLRQSAAGTSNPLGPWLLSQYENAP